MPCYYLPELVAENSLINLQGEEYHHLVQVMRKRRGDSIKVTNGKGILAECRIQQIDKKQVTLEVIGRESIERSKPQMALAFSLLKNKHDSLIIEKATELGCSVFYPIETERSVRRKSTNLETKFEKTAIAAIKQCDNAWLPEIKNCQILEAALDQIRKDGFLPVAALENYRGTYLSEIKQENSSEPICIVIGPEGGFSEEEIDLFRREEVLPVSLGNHVLRAETAAITAISQLLLLNLQSMENYY